MPPLSVRDRRAGNHSKLPKAKTGIPVFESGYYLVRLVTNVHLSLVYVHQLCWMAYKYGSKEPDTVRAAKQAYYHLQRKLVLWNSVLRGSVNVRHYWSDISALMRFTQKAAKLRGRSLSDNDRETERSQPVALGSRTKVIASSPKGAPERL